MHLGNMKQSKQHGTDYHFETFQFITLALTNINMKIKTFRILNKLQQGQYLQEWLFSLNFQC